MERNNVPNRILLIEDETEIRDLMTLLLKRQGFEVISLSSVEEFRNQFPNATSGDLKSSTEATAAPIFDLMILDWMLPGTSGFEFLKSIRKNPAFKKLPIIMVTAKAEPNEVVEGLEAGADDYLIKPFDASVLLARVKALMRRDQMIKSALSPDQAELKWGPLKIHLKSYEAFLGEEKLALTPTEYKLLVIMMQNHGKVFTREQLIQVVQGEGVNVIGRTVDTHVFSLRKKLGPLGDKIETARGIGYRFYDQESQS